MTERPTTREIAELLHDLAEMAKTPADRRDQAELAALLLRKRALLERLDTPAHDDSRPSLTSSWIDSGSGPGWSPSSSSTS